MYTCNYVYTCAIHVHVHVHTCMFTCTSTIVHVRFYDLYTRSLTLLLYYSSLSLLSLPSPYSDLPPNQGGRYTGFGNTVQKPQKEESDTFSSAWDTLSSGWSSFTSSATTWASSAKEKASQLGSTINESVIKPSSQQVCVCGWISTSLSPPLPFSFFFFLPTIVCLSIYTHTHTLTHTLTHTHTHNPLPSSLPDRLLSLVAMLTTVLSSQLSRR